MHACVMHSVSIELGFLDILLDDDRRTQCVLSMNMLRECRHKRVPRPYFNSRPKADEPSGDGGQFGVPEDSIAKSREEHAAGLEGTNKTQFICTKLLQTAINLFE